MACFPDGSEMEDGQRSAGFFPLAPKTRQEKSRPFISTLSAPTGMRDLALILSGNTHRMIAGVN